MIIVANQSKSRNCFRAELVYKPQSMFTFATHVSKTTPKQQAKPIAQSSSSAQLKRPVVSPLEGSSSKKQDNQEKDSHSDKSDSEEDIEFEKDNDKEQEEDDTQSELDENFGRNFTDVAEDVLLIDRLQTMVTAIIKAKRTPSPTQSKQLADLTQDFKEHFNRLQAKYLQIQGKYSILSRPIPLISL